MKEPSYIEKIRKLLRLAKSDNPHEAARAMQAAMDLAARHRLNLDDVAEEEDAAGVVNDKRPGGRRLSREMQYAMNIAITHFHVSICRTSTGSVFFGKRCDIDVALYVIDYLVTTCRGGLRRFTADEESHRRRLTPTKRINYISGFFGGINSQLVKTQNVLLLEHPSLAIVLSDDRAARKQAMAEMMGATKPTGELAKARRNVTALVAGYEDGRATQIRPALKASDALLALM